MKVHRDFSEPVFGSSIRCVKGIRQSSADAWCALIEADQGPIEDVDDMDGVCIGVGRNVLLMLIEPASLSVIAHEAMHAIQQITEHVGLSSLIDHGEAQACLAGYYLPLIINYYQE